MTKRKRERKAKDQLDGVVFAKFTVPVDPEVFMWCLNVYMAAGSMTMPTDNPETKKVEFEDGLVVSFTDRAENRGMLAMMKEARERGLDEEQRMAMGFRVMHFGDVLRAPELAHLRREVAASGGVDVAEALIRACATAKLQQHGGAMGFDLQDVGRVAAELVSADPSMAFD